MSAPDGAVTLGTEVDPSVTVEALYWNPLSVWSPLPTAGKLIDTAAVLPARSLTVICAVAVLALAVSGVPLISPFVSMLNPDGKSATPYSSMSAPPLGLMGLIASPTFSDAGTV